MYRDCSQAFNEQIIKYSRTFKAQLIFDNGVIVSDRIGALSVNGGSNMGSELKIGNTPCASLTADILFQNENYNGQKFSLNIGLKMPDGSFEFIPYGKYVVISSTTQANKTKITATDYMGLLDVEYKTELPYPTYADKVLQEISKQSGIEIDYGNIPQIPIAYAPRFKTMREVVGLIAGLAGKFAIFDRFGVLAFRWYEYSGYVTDLNVTENPKITDDNFKVNYLSVKINDQVTETAGDITATQGITIENEYATPETINNAFEVINGFEYRSCEVKQKLGDVRIDAWDIIGVTMVDGSPIQTIPMKTTLKYDGGISLTIKATAPNREGAKTPQQIEADKNKTEKADNALVISRANTFEQALKNQSQKIVDLFFYLSSKNFPFLLGTIQLTDIQQGKSRIDIRVNSASYKSYYMDLQSGDNVISFAEPIIGLKGGSHRVEIFIEGITAKIPASGATLIMTGSGLLNVTTWNGLLNIEDIFNGVYITPIFNFAERVSGIIDITAQTPEKADFGDILRGISGYKKRNNVETIKDNLYIEVV